MAVWPFSYSLYDYFRNNQLDKYQLPHIKKKSVLKSGKPYSMVIGHFLHRLYPQQDHQRQVW